MLKIICIIGIVILNATYLNRFIIKNKIIKIPNLWTTVIFMIFSIPLIKLGNQWSLTTVMLLITLNYVSICNLYESPNIKFQVFKTGFFTSTLIWCDYNFIILYPIILYSLIYYQRLNWRNTIIQLLGLLYPWFLYLVIDTFLNLSKMKFDIDFNNLTHTYSLSNYWSILIITLFLISLSLKELYINYHRKKEKSKKALNILCMITICMLSLSIYLKSIQHIYFLCLPASILIANYLIYTKYGKFRTFLVGLLTVSFIFKFLL